jgi:hypothetical protein
VSVPNWPAAREAGALDELAEPERALLLVVPEGVLELERPHEETTRPTDTAAAAARNLVDRGGTRTAVSSPQCRRA